MKSRKLVSIIIACYNAEKYIDTCLMSLLKQTYQNFEIIICDDASKDRSSVLLEKYKIMDNRIKVLHNKSNMFAAFSRNQCLSESKGEYIMIQDADDASVENRIEILVDTLEDSNADFVSSAVYEFEDTIKEIKRVTNPQKLVPSKWNFLWGLPFHHPSTMFRRECIISVDGYRVTNETRRVEDYDMFMRMYANGFKGIIVAEPLYYYRIDEVNIGRRTWEARKDEIKIRYQGFKAMKLMPIGLIFTLKPIPAHFVQKLKFRKLNSK